MSIVTLAYTFSVGAVIIAAQHNANFQNIYNDYNGNIQDVNIASNASIEYSKLSLNASILYGDLASSTISSLLSLIMPSGLIMMWSGTIATIPSGWVLCDGSNSTPDLRDTFIVGAKQDSGGVAKSNITGSLLQSSATGVMPAHTHDIPGGNSGNLVGGPILFDATDAAGTPKTTTSTGTGTKVISVFYALAFIMKS